jgi:PilZ domain
MTDRRRSTPERRERRRAPFVAAVKAVGPELSLAQARNLGEEGMELRRATGRELEPRTPLHLAFELPDGGGLVEVRGAVVFERAEAGGRWQATGVRFRSLSAADRARIARFVDAHRA